MSHKRILLVTLFLFMSLLLAPVTQAQQNDVNFDQILSSLGPRTTAQGYENIYLIFDILLYAIFFLSLVNMFLIPDKQLAVSLLNFTVILATVFAKVGVASIPGVPEVAHPNAIISMCALPVLPLNAVIFIFPLLIAGMTRKSSKYAGTPPSLFVGGLTGLIGGAYFFMSWALEIRSCATIGGTGV
ncbi:MAG: hypothetical protein SF029_09710 [bacterium]|nr:hypothetical protein [bacterium]